MSEIMKPTESAIRSWLPEAATSTARFFGDAGAFFYRVGESTAKTFEEGAKTMENAASSMSSATEFMAKFFGYASEGLDEVAADVKWLHNNYKKEVYIVIGGSVVVFTVFSMVNTWRKTTAEQMAAQQFSHTAASQLVRERIEGAHRIIELEKKLGEYEARRKVLFKV